MDILTKRVNPPGLLFCVCLGLTFLAGKPLLIQQTITSILITYGILLSRGHVVCRGDVTLLAIFQDICY